MSTKLQDFLDELTASEALKFICLFLAQNDDPQPPHIELGFVSQSEAFAEVGKAFDTKPRTVQNERDAFDKFTDSTRTGWDKPLPPRLVPIFDEYSGLSRDDMRDMSQAILGETWETIEAEIDLENIVSNFSSDGALKFLCLFLAQNEQPEPPHIELGYPSRRDAFLEIAKIFNTKSATVKNRRDAFDRHTDSSRIGWEGELPPGLSSTFTEFGSLPRNDMRSIALDILSRKWGVNMGELLDLKDVRENLADRLIEFSIDAELKVSSVLWQDIVIAYAQRMSSDSMTIVGDHAMRITSGNDCFAYVSSQELRQIWACLPYAAALLDYKNACDKIAMKLGFKTRKQGEAIFKKLSPTTKSNRKPLDGEPRAKLEQAIEAVYVDPSDRRNLKLFFFETDWSGVPKTLERNDWIASAIVSAGKWVNVAADRRGELTEALTSRSDFEPRLRQVLEAARLGQVVTGQVIERLKGGVNFINYGAPGTGKSFNIDEIAGDIGDRKVTTVFHPDVQNSDFIGTLKPVVEKGEVGYGFSPGPFLKAYVKAWNNPGQLVWLVIEELNRAPAAAVFGELFLLLDREGDGSGKYDVDYPSLECQAWVESKLSDEIMDFPSKLQLPSNFMIAATLNSADQGVYPLDTAFRRRWTQNYVKLDYDQGPDKVVKVVDRDGAIQEVHWREFVRCLNGVMESHGIREDRLLGPWFASEHELDSGAIPGKVLVYLWDDLFRNHDKSVVFSHRGSTYGGLVDAIENGKPVFSDALLAALTDAAGL